MSLRYLAPIVAVAGMVGAAEVSAGRFSDGDSRSSMPHIQQLRDRDGLSETISTTSVRSPSTSKRQLAQKKTRTKLNRLITKHAKANGVPVKLAHAVITVESRYNPRARGGAGEVGLMQIKPATARGIGYKGSTKALYDPETNLRWGMKYLGEAQKRGGGTVCGTILKYNAGHYAKRMNKISARYCGKVKNIMAKS